MTAIHDRRREPVASEVGVPWQVRPIMGERRGLPWWAAVAFAWGLTVIGAVVDFQIQDSLGVLFKGCYFVGSVGAICAVQRRSLFAPVVQPPLILAVTVPGAVLLAGGLPAGNTPDKILSIAVPLINGFPTMAITTGITLAIGAYRFFRERDPDKRNQSRKSAAGAGGPKGVADEEDPGDDPSATGAAAARTRGEGSNRSRPAPARQRVQRADPRRSRDPNQSARQPNSGSDDPRQRRGRGARTGENRFGDAGHGAPPGVGGERRRQQQPPRARNPRMNPLREPGQPPRRRPNPPPSRRPWDEQN